MGFEKYKYEDGDAVLSIPEWKQNLDKITALSDSSLLSTTQEESKIKEKEVGIKHSENNSAIRIKDNGDILIFAGDTVGIKLASDGRAIVFADRLQFLSTNIELLSSTNGVSINSSNIENNDYYHADLQKGKTEKIKEFIKTFNILEN